MFPDGAGDTNGYLLPSLRGLAIDREGNMHASFADDFDYSGRGVILRVTPTGTVTTLAGGEHESGSVDGTSSQAQFAIPGGLALDAGGNVVLADSGNNTIRKITPDGTVTTLAGTPPGHVDGVGSVARFRSPSALAVNSAGLVYVADNYSSLRRISPDGAVTTLVSSPLAAGTPSIDSFSLHGGVTVDESGNLYFADSNQQAVRKITPAESSVVIRP
jgi:sugar lactone lactonase YvrE